jgi:2-polyprenyl-6-methoxyphenol hydroxylase-like FAD-dependent oxidoreductase
MRVLIVGGGVAGLTLAAKLHQQRREPVVIERSRDYSDTCYGIGLYPLGSSVLHGLGVYQNLVACSLDPPRYGIANAAGEIEQTLDLSALAGGAGPLLMLSRRHLIDLLRNACRGLQIRMGTTVVKLQALTDVVRAAFSDGTTGEFDLVVGCDGAHSAIRGQVSPRQTVFDAGWTIWTWWGRDDIFPERLVQEYWGCGFFFGAYLVPGRCVFCVGLSTPAGVDPHAETGILRRQITCSMSGLASRVQEVGRALQESDSLFAWPMSDVRSRDWYAGRVSLCGDACSSFLPTAGIGASNTMRSAAALADELSKVDAAHVPLALELHEKRSRRLLEGNQDDSRKVARLMFVTSKLVAWGRDRIVRYYPATRFLKQIIASMHEPF